MSKAKKSTAEILAKLEGMASQAGEALFERASMAVQVLDDSQWIADTFLGDREAAEKMIAEKYFPDVCMSGWFDRLLALRNKFDLETWRQHRFNLPRLWYEYEKAMPKEPEHVVERKAPVSNAKYDKAVEEIKSLEYQNRHLKVAREEERARLEVQVQRRVEEVAELRERCHELQRELAEAQGRIATLEMLVEKYAPQMAVA